jgi:class 3 adenylate cyclase
MYGSYAKRTPSPDYPWAPDPEDRERWLRMLEETWGGPVDLAALAPSKVGDEAFERWWAGYLRKGASPGAVVALGRMNTQVDVRNVLPTISVPTLVVHRTGDRDALVGGGRYIAEHVRGAKWVELPGDDHLPWAGDHDALVDEIEEFLTGSRHAPPPDRVLATVLFTDIVGSTERAAALGDRGWRELLEAHHAEVRRRLERFRGREVDTTGDGFLATFDGPARAIGAAAAIRDGIKALGLELRAGLHTGECELIGEKLGGIAVHTGARVAAAASPGEILVSSTVKDLVAGSGIEFEDRGEHELKGVGTWRLFRVERAPA